VKTSVVASTPILAPGTTMRSMAKVFVARVSTLLRKRNARPKRLKSLRLPQLQMVQQPLSNEGSDSV